MEVWILGALAGCVSSTVGMGGGQLLVIGLAAWFGPVSALTWTGPALLVGSTHRMWLFRRAIHWSLVGRFVLGAAPAALCGGFVAGWVPVRWLSLAIAVVAVFAMLQRARGGLHLSNRALIPGGAAIGGLAATAGGGGVLSAPLWKGAGVEGDAYVGSMAAGAGSIHVARMVGYGASGLYHVEVLWIAGVLASGIIAGNLLGAALRRRLSQRVLGQLELLAVVGCALIAVVASFR